jgi:hypothetical protein
MKWFRIEDIYTTIFLSLSGNCVEVDGISWNHSQRPFVCRRHTLSNSRQRHFLHKECQMIRAWLCIRSHCVASVLGTGTIQQITSLRQYLSALAGNGNTYSFPCTSHGSSCCATQSKWSCSALPFANWNIWESPWCREAYLADSQCLPTSLDGLLSDGEFVGPAQTLANCGGRNGSGILCAEISIENNDLLIKI